MGLVHADSLRGDDDREGEAGVTQSGYGRGELGKGEVGRGVEAVLGRKEVVTQGEAPVVGLDA
jgi:hypothetical protein